MAHHRIGRDDDYWKTNYPESTSTDTDDEDDPPETPSSIIKQPSETPISYHSEVDSIPTKILTSISSPPPIMSGPSVRPDYDGQNSDWPYTTGPPPWATRGGDSDRGPPTTSTLVTKTYDWDHNGLKTTFTPTPTPTPVQSDDAASPEPTDDGFGLQNNGAGNDPNRTPVYAAAGVVPMVFIIIVAFLVFFYLRKRRGQRQAAAKHGHIEEMKMHPKPVTMPYIAPITPPSPPPQAALPQYSPLTPSSSHPPTASSSQPVILGPIPSGNNGAYLTGMDTSDLVSVTSAGGVSRQGTIVDRDPFADGRSLEEAPPPYRPSSLPPASLASTSRNSSVRMATPPYMTSRTQLIERSPFDDPEDEEVSDVSGPTLSRGTDAMSDVSELSYQIDPVIGRSPF